MKAKFPNRPDGLDQTTYSHYAEKEQCWFLNQGICSAHCPHIEVDNLGQYPVEFDHVDALSNGGSDSSYNIRPVCRSYNRWKSNRDVGRYHEPSYFDQDLTEQLPGLRPWQKELYLKVSEGALAPLYSEPSLGVLGTFALLTWTVGAGKTLGWLAFAFGVNKARAFRGVRIKRVLFLVQQRDLVSNIAVELAGENKIKSDVEKYLGLPAPRVFQLTESEQWDTNECKIADIVATCPQALWGFGDDEKARKTRDLRKKYLDGFDLIVLDEGHFAVHQYADFLIDAPMALKLIMSATPMDGRGRYLSSVQGYGGRFRYINVFADYTRVQSEGCLKELPSWEEGTKDTPKKWYPNDLTPSGFVNGKNYFCLPMTNGEYLNGDGGIEIDPLSPNQAIALGVNLANKVEGYDAQVLIKAENRHIANHIVKHLNEKYWDGFADAVYTGNKKGKSLDKNHPWMKGKAVVLVAIDMAQFGLNKPECTVIVWVARNMSLVEIIQRIGRALRVVKELPAKEQQVKLVWSDPSMTPFICRAIELIRDSIDEIKANFESMESLLEGTPAYFAIPSIVTSLPGLTLVDKQKIEALVLTDPDFNPPEEEVKALVDELAGDSATEEAKANLKEIVEEYIDKIKDPLFASGRVEKSNSASRGWLRLLLSAEPDPDAVTYEDLRDYIESMRVSNLDKKAMLLMLEHDEEYRADIHRRVVESQENTFKPMTNGYHPSEIIGTNPRKKDSEIEESYRRQIRELHFKGKPGTQKENGDRNIAIRTALCKTLCAALDIETFRDTSKGYKNFSAQLATALMTEKIRTRIIRLACGYCYEHNPAVFKPYHRLLEMLDE